MERVGNPYDNAQAESFIKTLKCEEVYLFEYENMAEARARLDYFLEEVYKEAASLSYVPPAEFEQQLVQRAPA